MLATVLAHVSTLFTKKKIFSFLLPALLFHSDSKKVVGTLKMSNRIGLLDLEKHFAFYGAYHSNRVNIIIHTLFVWPNVFATLLFLYSTQPILDRSYLGFIEALTFDGVLRLDTGFILTVIYAVFYIYLDNKSGVLAALLCFSCWIGSSFLAARLGHSLTLKVTSLHPIICMKKKISSLLIVIATTWENKSIDFDSSVSVKLRFLWLVFVLVLVVYMVDRPIPLALKCLSFSVFPPTFHDQLLQFLIFF